MPKDIITRFWRVELMLNEQAQHNVLTSILLATKAEGSPMHALTVRNLLTIRLGSQVLMQLK